MARLELEDLDAKVFVLARTPLLASMGRWVILSNGNRVIRNSAKKRNTDESTDRNVHQQTTSSKARSQHASLRIPRCVLVGDEERVMMKIPAANLVSPTAYGVLQRHWGRPPQALSIRIGWPGAAPRPPTTSSQICIVGACISERTERTERKTQVSLRPLSVRSLLNSTPATCCAS